MRMKRRLRLVPKPRSSGCVTVRPRLEPVKGCSRVQREFSDWWLLLKFKPDLRAGGEALLDAGVGERGVGDQRVGAVAGEVGLRRGLVGPVQLSDQRRDRRSGPPCRWIGDGALHREVGPAARPSTPSSSALVATEVPAVARPAVAGVGDHGAERSAHADGNFGQRVVQPAGECRRPGAQQFGIGRWAGCSAAVRCPGCFRWPGPARPAATGTGCRRGSGRGRAASSRS